jgi:HlyD family secretion protein
MAIRPRGIHASLVTRQPWSDGVKRLLKWLLSFAILGGLGALLYLKARPMPPLVVVQRIARGSITDTVSGVATGIVDPARRVTIQAEAVARIKEIRVQRGARVTAGDVLVVLNDADIQDQIRTLRAAIPVLELRVNQARTRVTQLQTEQVRTRKLVERGVLPKAQLENANFTKEVAALEGDAAQAALVQARVNLEVARASLRKTVVRAPFAGLVLDVFAEIGQQAMATSSAAGSGASSSGGTTTGSTALAATSSSLKTGLVDLADDSAMFVYVDVDEMDYGKLAAGQSANLSFDALGKRTLVGRVSEIFPYVSRSADQNRVVRVKIQLPESARGVVLPGMSVNVDIVVGQQHGVLLLPAVCVLAKGSKRKAVLKLQGDRLREVEIRPGISTWEQIAIASGVAEGELVAVPSTDVRLVDGMQVRVKGNAGGASDKKQK